MLMQKTNDWNWAIAEAERVLQDNDTVEKIKAVLRKAQKINPGKWTLSGKKDELKQKLREFVEEATLKGLKEDSHRAQVTSWHPGRGGVASRASPQQDSGAEDWLAKSREEVEGFKKAQVPSWAEAVLIDGGLEADGDRTAAAGRHRQIPAGAHAGRADGSSVQHPWRPCKASG
ncbi:unnamed protein product [Effrenium voratum]|uniref:Uncharacterized protein n=1 Tax=Effrenium voratum TaxID=2562239 RepID=A0AA36N5S5_9DINO|nr:unnamed protein product [Effrenium voratum]CAJ1412641.1 unnamed protein product [Effrenium voratum]